MAPAIPTPVRNQVLEALSRARPGRAEIVSAGRVGGGCINPSVRVETPGGEAFFLKWNDEDPALFAPEAEGLSALASALEEVGGDDRIRVPEVVGVGRGEDGPGWLLLEFVPEGRPGSDYGRRLGRGLAALHSHGEDRWGWEEDNFIGSLPQSNTPRPSWAGFWARERIRPQLRLAREGGFFEDRGDGWEELFARMEELVGPAEDEGPSLLHGDLWSGNVFPGPEGEPVLVDPAVYRGHREVDLAMTELFGGFSAEFYEGYREARPLEPGYRERRRALYQLYPLLVHVNLFGSGYVDRARRALRRALAG